MHKYHILRIDAILVASKERVSNTFLLFHFETKTGVLMIDWVSCLLPCVHAPMATGCVVSIDPDGAIEWSTPKRCHVEGSYSNKITVASAGAAGEGRASHLLFSGNPAKFLQGHNVFGTDDLRALVADAFAVICQRLELQPSAEECQAIRAGHYRLTRVDINYSFNLPSRADVLAWLRAAEFKSKTRHGRPSSKGGTLYWGKSSKRWALKAYSKGEEIEKSKKAKLPDIFHTTPLPDWADNKLRIELVIRSKELDELCLSTASSWLPTMPQRLYRKYLMRLDMTEQIRLTDETLMTLPQRLRATYVLWLEGHDLRATLPRTTYWRHRKELQALGINIDLRQDSIDRSNVVPLVRILEAQPADIPSWAFDLGLIHRSATPLSLTA